MTESNRMDRRENQLIDMRLVVSAFLETVTYHQHNFERMQRNFESNNNKLTVLMTEIRNIRADTQAIQTDKDSGN